MSLQTKPSEAEAVTKGQKQPGFRAKAFREGLLSGIPIALGYFPVAFTLGIMAISLGLNWWEATLISLMNLTSAGQFAGLSIMAAGGSLVEMALSQVIINLRYSLMSITLSQRVDDSISGIWRYIIPFSNTDEIFAVSVSKDRPVNRWYWLGLSLLPIIGWSSGTLFGALLGAVLPERLLNALGIAIYAMFIAIIIPAAKKSKAALVAVILGAFFSCLFYYIPVLKQVPSGFSVIICAVAAAALCAWLFPEKDEEVTA